MSFDTQLAPPDLGRSARNRAYRILLVDDERGIRRSLGEYLESHGFETGSADGAKSALELFSARRFDLVFADIAMPEMSGLDLLQELKDQDPDVEVIMMTAYLDISYAVQAMRLGAYDFLIKPFSYEQTILTIERARERQILKRQAEEAVLLRTQSVFQEQAVLETTLGFARAAEERDKFNIGHGARTAKYAALLAAEIGMPAAEIQSLRHAAMLHDVGKIGIDDGILNKPDRLTPEEHAVIERHSEIGDYMLKPISFLSQIRLAVRHHHERWDGRGYPDGLAGERIPKHARILSLADYFDSITSYRPYRSPMTSAQAMDVMRSERGRHFDPALLDAFLPLLERTLAG